MKLKDTDPLVKPINHFFGDAEFMPDPESHWYVRLSGVRLPKDSRDILLRQHARRNGVIANKLRTKILDLKIGAQIGDEHITEEYRYRPDRHDLRVTTVPVPQAENEQARVQRWQDTAVTLIDDPEAIALPNDWERFDELVRKIGEYGIGYPYDEA